MAILRRARFAIAVVVVAAVHAACGVGFVDEGYRGDAIWSLQADAIPTGTVDVGTKLRAALFFAPTLDTLDTSQMTELTASSLAITSPSSFTMNVFAPPSSAQMITTADGQSTGYAVGRLFAYDDANGNGIYDASESLVGAYDNRAFLYVSDPAPASLPTNGKLAPGFHALNIPQSCDFKPPPPTTSDDCGVPIGSPCQTDGDCTSAGICLKDTKFPWPNGYCVVPEPPLTACRPGGAVFMGAPIYSDAPPGLGFYLAPCTIDADCAISRPGGDQYQCDPGLLACIPIGGSVLHIAEMLQIEPFCAGMLRAASP